MFSVALCEDDTETRLDLLQAVEKHLERQGMEFCTRAFSCGEELLACKTSFDLIVMDIRMKKVDGLGAARTLYDRGSECPVIFVTSYPDYVFGSFGVHVVDYILKPFPQARLAVALNKALRLYDRNRKEDFILIKSGAAFTKLNCSDILYCESLGHKIRLATSGGTVEYYGSIEALQSKLGEFFFRCHRSIYRQSGLRQGKRQGRHRDE